MDKIRFRSNEVWDRCDLNDIDPDSEARIEFKVVPGVRLCLYDSEAGIGELRKSFVLFSPNLNNETIGGRLLTVRKRNQIPSGFRVSDAVDYENVYVVGDFTAEELLPLVRAGADVERVTGDTAKEMSDHLASLLA